MIDDTVRSMSFGTMARDYDRFRIGPPPKIVDLVIPGPAETVLDLGAGTGAMTRLLVERIAEVHAVDPDPRMRAVLTGNCPAAIVHEGTAEDIPLPATSVDAVVMASAWHWVEPARAIPEIARVLRPSGTLGLLWNRRDASVPWISDFEEFRVSVTGGDNRVVEAIDYYLEEPWLPAGSPFTDIEISSLPWSAQMTREDLVGLLTTYTGYLLAPEDRKPQLLREFADYIDRDERLGTGDTVEVPMRCAYWRARRV